MLVNIDVPDLAAAERFYTAAFGLRAARRLGPAALELLGESSAIYLLETPPDSATAGAAKRTYERHWTPIHLDFVVDALEPARDRAVAAGAKLERDIEDTAWGRIARFADPWGNGFCILQFTGRGYDAIAT
jgi:predicted enzyme related to lactoylglutathione lyase